MSQFTTAWYQAQLAKKAQNPTGPGVEDESDLHDQIIDECRRRGWPCLHGSMAARTRRTLGEPDFILLADKGRVLFVECKSRGGKLSVEQLGFKIQAELRGHVIHIVRSFEEFLRLL